MTKEATYIEPPTKTFTIELTKDELIILHYVMPSFDRWGGVDGDPLKDIYEMYHGDEEPDDIYKIAKGLVDKVSQLSWGKP